MQAHLDEAELVRAAVAVANAAGPTQRVVKGKRPEWARRVEQLLRGQAGAIQAVSPADARTVAQWLTAVATGRGLTAVRAQVDARVAKIELRPRLRMAGGKLELRVAPVRDASLTQLAPLGVALLISGPGWRGRFGRCTVCHRFFVDTRQGKGPKRWRVCSQKCRDHQKYQQRKKRLLSGDANKKAPP